MKEEIAMGRVQDGKKRGRLKCMQSPLINTKSNSVKRTLSSLLEEEEFFLCEQFSVCKCIRSSSERNDTWVNLHHYILTM